MLEITEKSGNVIISATIISLIIIIFSLIALLYITHNTYLDAYYIIDTFFGAPNSAATWNLAQLSLLFPPQKLAIVLSIVIIDNIGKLLIVSFVIAAVIDIVSYANLEKYISAAHARRMRNHIIICGYNPLAERLIRKLNALKKKCEIAVIDNNEEIVVELHKRHIPIVEGSFTNPKILKLASADKAKIIVFVEQDDAKNLIGIVEAKRLNKEIKALVRSTKEENMTKMYRVGADMCVLPEYIAGISIGEFLLKHIGVHK